ncbi:MAG: UDP-N-acetylglucosamine 2-epimerase (non-hydrolyzing) [Pseudomonadota bacterium]
MTGNKDIKVTCIVGARPNFMKMAPILHAFDKHGGFITRLIHTGQHYDVEMNAVFFEQLGLKDPDLNLEIGSGSQTSMTARIMLALEGAFQQDPPDLVLVVGDVNSTLAAALVAAKLRIPIAHVEAGLRSFDMDMPEEVNRLVTDRLSDLLLTTERSADLQLQKEGVASEAIHFVGNVMIDTLLSNLDKAISMQETALKYDAEPSLVSGVKHGYALVTLHRPSNVDTPVQLAGLLDVVRDLAADMPVIFTLHPRTKARIAEGSLEMRLDHPGILKCPPLSYFEMLGAMRKATLVITDSGGLQEETTALGVPCLTVRENTERPITIEQGTNTLVGGSPEKLREAIKRLIAGKTKRGRVPELWDGHAAERIAKVIHDFAS